MKTRLIFLLMLIICSSCGTNNKPVSDAQKKQIIGEVKEVVNTIITAAEEANIDTILGILHDSPDFVALFNGSPITFPQFVELGKSVFSTLENQKGTIIDEKYVVLDNSTVLFTANSKWLMNYKDGRSVLQDPWAMQYVFKKIDNNWKIISFNESGSEQSVKSEKTSNDLNQAELMKQFLGTWKWERTKDTVMLMVFEQYGKAFVETDYNIIKGNKTFASIWNYSFSEKDGIFKIFALNSNGNYDTWIASFTEEKKWMQVLIQNFNPANVIARAEIVFDSPTSFIGTIFDAQGVKIEEGRVTKVK